MGSISLLYTTYIQKDQAGQNPPSRYSYIPFLLYFPKPNPGPSRTISTTTALYPKFVHQSALTTTTVSADYIFYFSPIPTFPQPDLQTVYQSTPQFLSIFPLSPQSLMPTTENPYLFESTKLKYTLRGL